jgi:thioredoxin-related protein
MNGDFLNWSCHLQFIRFVSLLALLILGCAKSGSDAAPGPRTGVAVPAADETSDVNSIRRAATSSVSSNAAMLQSAPVAELTVPAPVLSDANAETAVIAPETKRKLIYQEEANGAILISDALKRARREHKNVLIEWGGNWCGWCYKLHDVFHHDAIVRPIVHEEFVLVLIDQGANHDLMLKYGGKDRDYSFPHLTVLDAAGEVLTNQDTGSLEEGSNHDPQLVSGFLSKWVPAKIDAETALATAIQQATSEDKRVLLRVGTPYCGWCDVLSRFMQEHGTVFAKDYVDIRLDTMRMTNGEAVAARYGSAEAGGVPWMVILDEAGKAMISSSGPDGNIGYPYQPGEVAHFINMLTETRKRLTDAELSMIAADLNAYRERQEGKSTEL